MNQQQDARKTHEPVLLGGRSHHNHQAMVLPWQTPVIGIYMVEYVVAVTAVHANR